MKQHTLERAPLLQEKDAPSRTRRSTLLADVRSSAAGEYPNIAIDEFSEITEEVQPSSLKEDISRNMLKRYHPEVVEAARRSIYSVDTVADIAEKHGLHAVKRLSTGVGAIVFQCFIFLVSVSCRAYQEDDDRTLTREAVAGGVHPLIFEYCIWNPVHQEKRKEYIEGTVYISYYLLSVLLGNMLTLVIYGKKSLKDCWNPKYQLLMVPAAAILAFVESLDGFIFERVDAALKTVISQVRLPLIALIGATLLGRSQNSLQWCLIAGITVSIAGYSYVSLASSRTSTAFGVWLCVFQGCCAAIGSTVSEVTLKRIKFPFCIQMSQARFISAVASFLGLIYRCSSHIYPSLFVGWNYRILLLVFWLAFRDWVMTFVLKSLSALWKSLASGLALCIAYFLETIVYDRQLDFVIVAFISCLVLDILGYALSKKTPKMSPLSSSEKKNDEEANIGK